MYSHCQFITGSWARAWSVRRVPLRVRRVPLRVRRAPGIPASEGSSSSSGDPFGGDTGLEKNVIC